MVGGGNVDRDECGIVMLVLEFMALLYGWFGYVDVGRVCVYTHVSKPNVL